MTQFVQITTADGTVYDDIVPSTRPMNPATEDLLYADELREGMRVLLAGSRSDEKLFEYYFAAILRDSRWCRVTKIRIDGDTVSFVGVYDDNTLIVRQGRPNRGWLVKKNSIPLDSE